MRNISRGRRRNRNSGCSSFSSPSPIRPPDIKPEFKKVKLDGVELADGNVRDDENKKQSEQVIQIASGSTSSVQQIIVSYESMGDLGRESEAPTELKGENPTILESQRACGSKGVESEVIRQGGLPPTKLNVDMQVNSSSVDQDSVVVVTGS